MSFPRSRLAKAIESLPEKDKLYATLAYFEELDDSSIASALGVSDDEVGGLAEETRARLAPFLPLASKEVTTLVTATQEALRERLRETTGRTLDRAGRIADIGGVYLSSIGPKEREASETDIKQGGGNELRVEEDKTLAPRFHSARSSCALAVNAFGPWRLRPKTLSIGGLRGFRSLRFERKCPIDGVPSHREPPNLDVLAEGDQIVAIESKLIEYLTSKKEAHFADVYDDAVGELADSTWAAAYQRLKIGPEEFQCFGGAQIIKHYLGLRSMFPKREVTLVYLFWEPEDARGNRVFEQHRAEVKSFAEGLGDPLVTFRSLTYTELWDEWDAQNEPAWLSGHLKLLRERYSISISQATDGADLVPPRPAVEPTLGP